MAMLMQDKFLDIDYLKIRLQENKDIRNKSVTFSIVHSDRPNSKSLYIYFYFNDKRRTILRISDHISTTTPHKQFILELGKEMPKNRKEMFVRTINNCIARAKEKSLDHKIKLVDYTMEN